jgi:Flp pilus assembly protein TadB
MVVTKKQKNQLRQYAKMQKEEERKRATREKKRKIAFKFAKPFMSEPKEEELKKLLTRLNKDKYPEEVVLEQITYMGIGVLVSLIMFTANRTLGLVSALFIVLGWFYPVDELRKEYEKKNTDVAINFPEFYSMVFYQYSKSVNIYLADVIRDYLPNASENLADELGVMLDNIDYADEEYALRQLKRRVPKHFIIKFCDIMETRLRGYDNVSQMQYLKNEIDAFRVTELEKELARRVSRNNVIQVTLIAVLVVYIFIFYMFEIVESLKMFQ